MKSGDDVALGWAGRFVTDAPVASAVPFGSGHVNKTYLVTDRTGGRYVLQSLNQKAFHNPTHVMENIVRVTAAMSAQITDPRRHLTLVPSMAGGWWCGAEADQCWRMYRFIDGSAELSLPVTPDEFAAVGQAFGDFLVRVSVVPAGELHVTIPDFHNEPRYVALLKDAIARDPLGRVHEVVGDIERVLAFEAVSHDFDHTAMPLRVTHNDAKISNVLFDAVTRAPLCVVDLDTVQPGYAVNDFGDAIRSGATSANEDEPDVTKVHFEPELFAAFTRGYLAACGGVLEPVETTNLRQGARMMTLEATLRFLTDYIDGDLYYKIDYETQNRDRARNQLTLLEDIQRQWQVLEQVIYTISHVK